MGQIILFYTLYTGYIERNVIENSDHVSLNGKDGTYTEEKNVISNTSSPSKDYNSLCHEEVFAYGYLMTDVGHFWLEGILLLIVGLFGVAGNIMTIVVLRKMETNTTFNRLLMSLGRIFMILSLSLFFYFTLFAIVFCISFSVLSSHYAIQSIQFKVQSTQYSSVCHVVKQTTTEEYMFVFI